MRIEIEDFRGEELDIVRDYGLDHSPGLWITWERQRRTTELARRLGLRLFRLLDDRPRARRYLALARETARILRREKPAYIIVQNPSVVLAAAACILKPRGVPLIVDRHSNFKMTMPRSLTRTGFVAISNFSLRHSDLTVVTNDFLADLVTDRGGQSIVLQDPFPHLDPAPASLSARLNCMFVSTWARDEPWREVIRSAVSLPEDVTLHITGRPPRHKFDAEVLADLERAGSRVNLTGFLPDDEYFGLMAACDAVMVLTTAEHCLVCGAYEAFSLAQPLILSDSSALREYFGATPHYTTNDTAGIRAALDEVLVEKRPTSSEMSARKQELESTWSNRFSELVERIAGIVFGDAPTN